MSLLRVDLRQKVDDSYDIEVRIGAQRTLVNDIREIKVNRKFAVISDSKVAKLYGGDLIAALQAQKVECDLFVFPSGERSKSWEMVERIAREMLRKEYSRSDMIVALGGGVTGDLAGFVAAVYMRGIRFVQVPTTLLAMTDAAIGGKTGVNVPEGKNLLGAFHQPEKVYVDVEFLRTLPKKDMQSGYAEVVKHAIIGDKKLFKMIESAENEDLFEDHGFINELLARSCAVKVDIVSSDEKENYLRMKLNLGHTLGHAIEKEMDYEIDHGRAVSIGLAKICDVAVARKMLGMRDCQRVKKVLEKLGLPVELPRKLDKIKLVEAMRGDKKMKDQRLNFVVPIGIGNVIIDNSITPDEFLSVL